MHKLLRNCYLREEYRQFNSIQFSTLLNKAPIVLENIYILIICIVLHSIHQQFECNITPVMHPKSHVLLQNNQQENSKLNKGKCQSLKQLSEFQSETSIGGCLTSEIDSSRWMEKLLCKIASSLSPPKIKMRELVIPGTHHSSVNSLKAMGKLLTPWAVTQTLSLSDQFKAGVRFYHLAVSDETDQNQLCTKHYFTAKPLDKELEQIRRCLLDNPREIAILFIKRDKKSSLSEKGAKLLIETLWSIFFDVGIMKSTHSDDNILSWYKDGQFPGRVILTGFRNFPNSLPKQYLWECQNSYRLTFANNAGDVIKRLQQFALSQPPLEKQPAFMNYECIVTLDFESIMSTSTILSEAKKVQKLLVDLLKDEDFWKKVNILMMDHISAVLGWQIVKINEDRLIEKLNQNRY